MRTNLSTSLKRSLSQSLVTNWRSSKIPLYTQMVYLGLWKWEIKFLPWVSHDCSSRRGWWRVKIWQIIKPKLTCNKSIYRKGRWGEMWSFSTQIGKIWNTFWGTHDTLIFQKFVCEMGSEPPLLPSKHNTKSVRKKMTEMDLLSQVSCISVVIHQKYSWDGHKFLFQLGALWFCFPEYNRKLRIIWKP